MFGLIKKKDLSAFAERVHNDNALDARMGAPLQPVSYEDHKKAAYWNGYADGSCAFLLALHAFIFGGKKRKMRPKKTEPELKRYGEYVKIEDKVLLCREFETIVTVQIHDIDKNVELPEWFEVEAYKLGVEDRICRALRDADLEGDNVNVKVQVFVKDDEGVGR